MYKDCVGDTDGETRRVESPSGTTMSDARYVRWISVSGSGTGRQHHDQQNIEQNKVKSHQKKKDRVKNLREWQVCDNYKKHESDPCCSSSDESV